MLATKIEDAKREEGFTLIELLVVVLIIGILAAIAIPAFLSQRARAWESELTSGVRNVALEIESLAVQEGGDYREVDEIDDADAVVLLANSLLGSGSAAATGATDPTETLVFSAPVRTATAFCIEAIHTQLDDTDNGNRVAYISSDGGLTAIAGTCPAAGDL